MTKIDITYTGNLQTRCQHVGSGALIQTEAPKDNGGEGSCFSPTDLLSAALGSCVMTLMGIAAKRLGVDLKGTRIEVTKNMVSSPIRRIGHIHISVYCPHLFSAEITEKLIRSGQECPVHYSLHPEIKQEFTFYWGV